MHPLGKNMKNVKYAMVKIYVVMKWWMKNDKENNSETDKNNTSDKLLNEQDTNCSVVENYIV